MIAVRDDSLVCRKMQRQAHTHAHGERGRGTERAMISIYAKQRAGRRSATHPHAQLEPHALCFYLIPTQLTDIYTSFSYNILHDTQTCQRQQHHYENNYRRLHAKITGTKSNHYYNILIAIQCETSSLCDQTHQSFLGP